MNKVYIIGRLTKDPELRYTSNDKAVSSYTVALNDGYGEKQETIFVNITTWNKSAEFVSKYFKKGQQIAIIGRLVNNDYTDKNGNNIHTLNVVSEEIEFVGDKKESGEDKKEEFREDKLYQEDIIIDDDDLPF